MKWQFYRLAGSLFFTCLLLFWSFGEWVDAYEARQDSYTLSATQLFNDAVPAREAIPAAQLQLPAELTDELRQGQVIALQSSNSDWYYYKAVGQADLLWRFGPFNAPSDDSHDATLILLMFYTCLMLASAAMLYPLFRDLHHLQQKAGVFMAAPSQMQQTIAKHSPIYPLARDFVDAGNQLVRWVELHQFLSRAISHDVRTPLSRMRFALELCQDDMPQHYWQRLQTDVQQIEQLVTNYLNFARFEQHRQPPAWQYTELSAFAAQLQQQFKWLPSEVSLQLVIGEGFAWLEPTALQIACQNLLSNALRYARKQVRCSLYCDKQWLHLQIDDDGVGFPEGIQPEAFYQLDNSSSNGFGLGLYIVSQVVAWQQGHFYIRRSTLLGGACVELTLPMEPTEPPAQR